MLKNIKRPQNFNSLIQKNQNKKNMQKMKSECGNVDMCHDRLSLLCAAAFSKCCTPFSSPSSEYSADKICEMVEYDERSFPTSQEHEEEFRKARDVKNRSKPRIWDNYVSWDMYQTKESSLPVECPSSPHSETSFTVDKVEQDKPEEKKLPSIYDTKTGCVVSFCDEKDLPSILYSLKIKPHTTSSTARRTKGTYSSEAQRRRSARRISFGRVDRGKDNVCAINGCGENLCSKYSLKRHLLLCHGIDMFETTVPQ
jgi:hypothetical protein